MLNPHANGKIQGLFKAFECFSSTVQGKLYFQVLFKTVLYIQVLLKACANPAPGVASLDTRDMVDRFYVGVQGDH